MWQGCQTVLLAKLLERRGCVSGDSSCSHEGQSLYAGETNRKYAETGHCIGLSEGVQDYHGVMRRVKVMCESLWGRGIGR